MLIYLRNIHTGKTLYLLGKNVFNIASRDCDLLIVDDQYINQCHAQITIKDDTVFLKDFDSWCETLLNGEEVSPNLEIALKEGDEIKFGALPCVYRFVSLNFTVCCSCFDSASKMRLREHLSRLKLKFSADWTPRCTHLTVFDLNLTVKFLLALLDGKQIVQVEYWETFVENVNASIKPPLIKDYQNLRVAVDFPLPQKINLRANPMRRRLFEGKLFLFFRESTKKQVEEVITKAGGASVSWEKDKPNDLALIPHELVVIRSESSDDSYASLIEPYLASGRRLIFFEEIAHAVLHCSCRKFCNSKRRLAKKEMQFPTTMDVEDGQKVDSKLVEMKPKNRRNKNEEISAKRVRVKEQLGRKDPSSSNADVAISLTESSKQSTFSQHLTSNRVDLVKMGNSTVPMDLMYSFERALHGSVELDVSTPSKPTTPLRSSTTDAATSTSPVRPLYTSSTQTEITQKPIPDDTTIAHEWSVSPEGAKSLRTAYQRGFLFRALPGPKSRLLFDLLPSTPCATLVILSLLNMEFARGEKDAEERFGNEQNHQPATIIVTPLTCWRCGERGHRRDQCRNPISRIFCSRCGKVGTMTIYCCGLYKD